MQEDAAGAGDLADLGEGLDGADVVVRVHDRHEHRSRGDGDGDVIWVDEAVGTGRDNGDVGALPGEVLAGGEDGLVLDAGGDDVAARATGSAGDAGDG